MIIFDRRKGTLTHVGSAEPFAFGVWSGHGEAHNDPAYERQRGIGPIPAGDYAIGPREYRARLGPHVMSLTPINGTETFGRSGFFIHGDSVGDVSWTASDGCVIAPRSTRDCIDAMVDRRLRVI